MSIGIPNPRPDRHQDLFFKRETITLGPIEPNAPGTTRVNSAEVEAKHGPNPYSFRTYEEAKKARDEWKASHQSESDKEGAETSTRPTGLRAFLRRIFGEK